MGASLASHFCFIPIINLIAPLIVKVLTIVQMKE